MVVSIRRGVGDDRLVDGGVISSTMISDMTTSHIGDIGDGGMKFGVVVSGAMILNMFTSRKWDIGGNGEVACGVVVFRRKGRGDGRLIEGVRIKSLKGMTWYNKFRIHYLFDDVLVPLLSILILYIVLYIHFYLTSLALYMTWVH